MLAYRKYIKIFELVSYMLIFLCYQASLLDIVQLDQGLSFQLSFFILLTKFPIPDQIYFSSSEFGDWKPLTKLQCNKSFQPKQLNPVYFGKYINQCIPKFTRSQDLEMKYNILHNAIMKHPGYFVTPDFIFRDNYFLESILHEKIASRLRKSENGYFNFSARGHLIIENGIAVRHRFAANYYHILLEILPSFFLLGKKTVEQSMILYENDGKVGFDGPLFMRIFNFFGFNISINNFISVNDKTVMAKNLIILSTKRICQLDNETILFMREYVYRRYFDIISQSPNNNYSKNSNKIDSSNFEYFMKNYVPFRFCCFVHKRNKQILNQKELISAIENKYKKVKFEIPPIFKQYSILQQMIYFHETIFAMGIHAASFANILWMMPKTILLEFSLSRCYSAGYRLAQIVGVNFYAVLFSNNTGKKGNVMADIDLVMKIMEYEFKELNNDFHVDYSVND